MKMTINGTRSPSPSEILCALRNLINRPKLKSKDIAIEDLRKLIGHRSKFACFRNSSKRRNKRRRLNEDSKKLPKKLNKIFMTLQLRNFLQDLPVECYLLVRRKKKRKFHQ